MLVDDESDINLMLKIVLKDHGFEIDAYDDPIVALNNYKAGSYNLLKFYNFDCLAYQGH